MLHEDHRQLQMPLLLSQVFPTVQKTVKIEFLFSKLPGSFIIKLIIII